MKLKCKQCSEEKHISDFRKDSSRRLGYRECKQCWNKHKKIHNKRYRAKKIGLSIDEYEKLKIFRSMISEVKTIMNNIDKMKIPEQDKLFADGKRRCAICHKIKQINCFFKSSRKKHGYDTRCKECDKSRNKNLSGEAIKRRREKQREYKHKAYVKQNDRNRRRARKHKLQAIQRNEYLKWVGEQEKVCYWCGNRCGSKYHVDHYIPLAKGGRHELNNLVISCPKCNMEKGAKMPDEYAMQKGRLL